MSAFPYRAQTSRAVREMLRAMTLAEDALEENIEVPFSLDSQVVFVTDTDTEQILNLAEPRSDFALSAAIESGRRA
jgi:hypothetical protein